MAQADPLECEDLFRPKFEITSDTQVGTAGSCFAQHIGSRLRGAGAAYLDLEPAPPALAAENVLEHGYGLFSARYGNVYTVRQFLQLFEEAFGEARFVREVWEDKGRFFDSARPSIEPGGFKSVDELNLLRRQQHLPAVRRLFEQAEVLIFTLGLTEAWTSRRSGEVFQSCPGVVAGRFDKNMHCFQNFTVGEILADFTRLAAAVKTINPGLRWLLTVSPVPLTATATDQHVLAASTYSKSVLRAAAGELRDTHGSIDYFPSFEMITSPAARGVFFESNLRTVTAAGVDHVMTTFLQSYRLAAGRGQPRQRGEVVAEAAIEGLRAVCDDEMLDPLTAR